MFTLDHYTIIATWFPRLLGLVYFCALFPLLFQIKGLIGENGILPLPDHLEGVNARFKKRKYFFIPTLFWINSSDQAILAAIWTGITCSALLMLGIYPPLMLFILYFIHLSIVHAGQEFLSYGWEGFLLEITIQTFFLSLTTVPNLFVWISLNFLLFRFHIQAGVIKLQSRDPNWRNLTALTYHYQTQPIPNRIAWYAHKLPLPFQKFSNLLMFIIELVIPFGIFGTEDMRAFVFVALFGLQFMIGLTGNFSYLNLMTAALCTILLSNQFLSPFIPTPVSKETPFTLDIFLSICGLVLIGLQLIRLWDQFFPNKMSRKILYFLHPFHLANRYAIFGMMTTVRYEVIIEGSDDRQHWKEYLFKYKPSEVTRRPRQISPFQPRLDWQVWFLPFHDFHDEVWFKKFLVHLLKGTPSVIELLRENPFPEHPPKYIRVQLYKYEFSTAREKKESGSWWRREFVGAYSPTLALR